MASFPLNLRKINQAASGGSHVTCYEAAVDIRPADHGVTIEVAEVEPVAANPKSAIAAAEHIRRGVHTVLSKSGFGAHIRVGRIVIHPVDCKPYKFEYFTVDALDVYLRENPLIPSQPAGHDGDR